MIIISICFISVGKYHLRFNVERKFHELNGVQFTSAVSSEKISKKLLGLKWISPRKNTKEEILLEVNQLNAYKNILLKDKSKKRFARLYLKAKHLDIGALFKDHKYLEKISPVLYNRMETLANTE